MPQNAKQQTGKLGEDIAADYLSRNDYKIICRNFKNKWGEIDIIATKRKVLVFVEVKTLNKKQSPLSGAFSPENEITPKKQNQLLKMVKLYLSQNKMPFSTPCQIDIIAIELNEGSAPIIRHHQNALADSF